MSLKTFSIGSRPIGVGHPCFIIAEAGVNHNGDLDLARKLVDVAADAGADAVKFQTFSADRLVTMDAPQAEYQIRNTGKDEGQYAMLKRLELSSNAHQELMNHCAERGILFLSTPFDEESADFLEQLGLPAFKIPSGEITNTPFLQHVARKGRPMIVSTGMSTLEEVRQAVAAIRATGNPPLALLHCVSNYPADPRDVNLRAMATMQDALGVPVGYSDHTMGQEVALAAVALGACVLEKHFTLDRNLPGPDHKASLEPDEFIALIRRVRTIEEALGDGGKRCMPSEEGTKRVARKSLFAAMDVPAGTPLEYAHLAVRRPGDGLAPTEQDKLLGKVLVSDLKAGSKISLEHFQ